MPLDFNAFFNNALPYDQLLQRCANSEQRLRWRNLYDSIVLAPEQKNCCKAFAEK